MDLFDACTTLGGGCGGNEHSNAASDLTKLPSAVISSKGFRPHARAGALYTVVDNIPVYVKASGSDLSAPEVASYPDVPDYRLIQKVGE